MSKTKTKKPKTKPTTINVTASNIKATEHMSRTGCAVAIAVKGKLNNDCQVYVASNQLIINKFPKKGASHTVKLPKKATDFIKDLDAHPTAPPSPISFTIDVPTKYLK